MTEANNNKGNAEEVINIPAAVLRGAIACMAKNDIRYYLNGIFISSKGFVAGTNGHMAFKADIENPPSEDVIVKFNDTIPGRCESVDLVLNGNDVGLAHLRYIKPPGNQKRLVAYEKIDGKYPDVLAVFPGIDRESIDTIAVNAHYVGIAAKIFGKQWPLKFEFFGPTKPIRITSRQHRDNNPVMLVMPGRD